MPKENQASPAEAAERTSVMLGLRRQGYSQADAVNWCYENTEWGAQLTKRMLRNYYKKTDQVLREAADQIDRRAEFGLTKERYELLYYRALQDSDYSAAGGALKQIVQLLNLNQADALKVDWRDDFTEAEAEALFDQLAQAALDRRQRDE